MTPLELLQSGAGSLLRASWQASILAVLVLVTCRLSRPIPARWRYSLWLVVLARLLLPVVPQSPLSLFNLVNTSAISLARTSASQPQRSLKPAATQPLETKWGGGPTFTANGPVQPEVSPASSFNESPIGVTLRLAQVAAVVWVLGVLVMMLQGVVSRVRLRWLLRRCRVVDEQSVLAAFEACRVESGVRRHVGLLVTDQPIAPALVGEVHPRIIVSAPTLRALGSDELLWLFRHELAHVRRWDVAIQRLWWWARTLHWFNPLVWWAVSRARTEAELACDESVLAGAPRREHVGYGHALLKVAELLNDSKPVPGAVGLLMREPALTTRIRKIAIYRPESRMWTVVAATLLISLASVGLTDAVEETPGTLPPPSSTAVKTEQSPAPPTAATSKSNERPTTTRTMLIHVVGPDGKPMPGAKVYTSIFTKKGKRDYVCDDSGQAVVELPQTFDILRIWARSDGYVPLFAQWWPKKQVDGHLVPEEFTFQLPQGTLIGGFVRNEDGQPIAGARVEVKHVLGVEERKPRPRLSTWLALGPGTRTTDAQGRWSLDNVPAGDDIDIRISLSHPDYVDDRTWGGLQREQNVTTQSLRTGYATIVMRRGISVTGTVTDPNSKPVPGAVVVWGRSPPLYSRGSKKIRTDERGVYRFPPLPPGPMAVTVMAQGWAPDLREIEISTQNPPADFQLKPGRTIRLRIVDEESGAPIPQVQVDFSRWRDSMSLYSRKHPYVLDNNIPFYADEKGLYEWTWAPEDPVTYSFYKKGYQTLRDQSLTADDLEHEIRLAR